MGGLIPMWLVASVISGMCSNGFNFMNRYILNNNQDSTAYAWWFEFIRTVFFLLFVVFQPELIFSLRNLIVLVSLGVVEFISVYVFMKMHAYTHLSISTIITRLRVVWTPILALLFIDEKLAFYEYLGILVIFIGQSIVLSPRKLKFDKGVKLTLLSSVIVSVLSLLTKSASHISSTPVVMVFMGTPTILGFPLAMKGWSTRVRSIWKLDRKKIAFAVTFNIAAMYFLVWAYRIGPVSKVVGVYNSMMIFLVLAGVVFLKEKEMVCKKLLGSLVTLAGIWLIV